MAFEMITAEEAVECSIKSFEEDSSVDFFLKRIDSIVREACLKGDFACVVSKRFLMTGDKTFPSEFGEVAWEKYKTEVLQPFQKIKNLLLRKMNYFGFSVSGIESDSYDDIVINWEAKE